MSRLVCLSLFLLLTPSICLSSFWSSFLLLSYLDMEGIPTRPVSFSGFGPIRIIYPQHLPPATGSTVHHQCFPFQFPSALSQRHRDVFFGKLPLWPPRSHYEQHMLRERAGGEGRSYQRISGEITGRRLGRGDYFPSILWHATNHLSRFHECLELHDI